jgi:Aminomethyltransferase folate-binding domain
MAETVALSYLLEQAGAVMTFRGGQPVPAHFGSAPGELAVCVQRVGLAHRPDLAVVSLTGPGRVLDRLLERVVGHEIAPGGTAFEGGAWWCRSSSQTDVVLVSRRVSTERLMGLLRHNVSGFSCADLIKCSEERLVFNVVGRRTEEVLADLGVLGPSGDVRDAAPFCETQIRGHEVAWLLEERIAALAIVEPTYAAAVWQAIDEAGRRYGVCCVGLEAIERYALLERAQLHSLTLL